MWSVSGESSVPDFRVHMTGSALVGVGYAAAGWGIGAMPPMTCALAGGLCAVAGMLPDLDSGPSNSLHESMAFAGALTPLLMLHRFQQWGLSMEAMILAGVAIYLGLRFGLTWILENHSAHRGMLHSLPAALIAGLVAFLAFGAEVPLLRYFIASAVVIGFITHLVLDEIWAVRNGWFGPKMKKAFGTALKFYGPEAWSNLLTYVLVVVLGALAAGDAARNERVQLIRQQMEQATRTFQNQQAPWQYRR